MESVASTVSADDEPAVQAFIRERFVAVFLGQSGRAQIGLLGASALIAWIWYHRTHAAEALGWMMAVIVITLLRFAYTDRFVHRFGESGTTRGIVAVLLVNGVLMAYPVIAFSRLTDLEHAAIAIILLGSATASVVTTSGYRSVFLAFAAPMLLALAMSWVLIPREHNSVLASFGIAVLVLAFLLFLVSIGRQAHDVFEEASRFRYGGQQLNRELRRAFDQASEANRAKTHFLAAASHDLRQPLHSINVLVAALTLRELDPRSREIVVLLDSVNQTLARQLDGLLDVSKLDAGTVHPKLALERLDTIVCTHHDSMMPIARERGLTLSLVADAQVSVLTDAALLGRILGNLTDNAFKFTPRSGTVTLRVWRDGEHAVLAVSDTGVGIAAEEHERVFAEFYQVGNVDRDRSQGLGLGLSIVRRLCDLLGAQLRLDSSPGIGTTVTVRLLAVDAVAPAVARVATPRIAPGLGVLVVDDEQFVRESMRLLLSELGCIVHLAESTEQARQLACTHPIDVVLSDFRLREGDSGIQAMRAVQQVHPKSRAALLTGVANAGCHAVAEALLAVQQLGHRNLQVRQQRIGGAGVKFSGEQKCRRYGQISISGVARGGRIGVDRIGFADGLGKVLKSAAFDRQHRHRQLVADPLFVNHQLLLGLNSHALVQRHHTGAAQSEVVLQRQTRTVDLTLVKPCPAVAGSARSTAPAR